MSEKNRGYLPKLAKIEVGSNGKPRLFLNENRLSKWHLQI